MQSAPQEKKGRLKKRGSAIGTDDSNGRGGPHKGRAQQMVMVMEQQHTVQTRERHLPHCTKANNPIMRRTRPDLNSAILGNLCLPNVALVQRIVWTSPSRNCFSMFCSSHLNHDCY